MLHIFMSNVRFFQYSLSFDGYIREIPLADLFWFPLPLGLDERTVI